MIDLNLILLTFVIVETAKPRIIDDGDVIVKVTGSTICGSDLHLYHGMSVVFVNSVSRCIIY